MKRDAHQDTFAAVAAPSPQDVDSVKKVCFFVEHDGCLILVARRHKDGSVSVEPPGGKIDPKQCGAMETHGEAIVREGTEELNILLNPKQILAVELHPVTKSPVGYYACEHVSGIPANAAMNEKTGQKEHLGVLKIAIDQIQTYEDLELIALDIAEKIVEVTLPRTPLARPIDFRVPEGAVMNYLQQLRQEPGAAFNTREPRTP